MMIEELEKITGRPREELVMKGSFKIKIRGKRGTYPASLYLSNTPCIRYVCENQQAHFISLNEVNRNNIREKK